jgi:hypothetical protein
MVIVMAGAGTRGGRVVLEVVDMRVEKDVDVGG